MISEQPIFLEERLNDWAIAGFRLDGLLSPCCEYPFAQEPLMPTATVSEPKSRVPTSNEVMSRVPRTPLVLKGYIRGENGQYEGVCLNLNLVACGRTLEETDKKLMDLILAYLTDAQKSGTWNDLVPRRAPLSYYVEYYRLKIMHHFRSLVDFKLFVRTAPCSAHA
jgi:hypothetical protein